MTVKLSTKGQLVIPQPIREAMGLQPGMRFHIRQQENTIVLEPVDFTSPIQALYGKYAQEDLLSALEQEHKEDLTRDASLQEYEEILP